jgi:hypothetical protein
MDETLFTIKNWMPKYKSEYGFKPTQSVGDRCVRGGWCFVCISVTKLWFIYRTVLEKSVFLEGEF